MLTKQIVLKVGAFAPAEVVGGVLPCPKLLSSLDGVSEKITSMMETLDRGGDGEPGESLFAFMLASASFPGSPIADLEGSPPESPPEVVAAAAIRTNSPLCCPH